MTEPSKQARDLAWGVLDCRRTFDNAEGVHYCDEHVESLWPCEVADGAAHLIDDALAEARQEGGEKWRQQWLDDTNRLEGWREQDESKIGRLTAERDEMAATVERVRALADEWDSDTEFAHKAHYADELRDALDGGESDE